MAFDRDNQGAFWLARDRQTREVKLTRNGDEYWTGSITIAGVRYPATMFYTPQEKKNNEAAPDYKISINVAPVVAKAVADVKVRMAAVPSPVPQSAPQDEIRVEDIPF